MHWKYTSLYIVFHDVFSIIPHGVRVEASCSLRQVIIGWGQSTTTGETFCENVMVRQSAQASNGILAGDDAAFDMMNTENDLEMKKEAEER